MKFDPRAPLALILVPVLPALALAVSGDFTPMPERNPLRVEDGQDPGLARVAGWSADVIEDAKAECVKLLANVVMDYELLPPIRRGLCGTPVPLRVKSIGNNPKVVISPPATINCRLAAALDKWLKNRVQPEARVVFGSPVVKLRNAASYACRNRYGNPKATLSEHARANALDISTFTLASGERVTVLESWPRVVSDSPDLPPLPDPNPGRAGAVTQVVDPLPVQSATLHASPAVSYVRVVGNTTEAVKINPFVAATPLPAPVSVIPASLPGMIPLAESRPRLPMAKLPVVWTPVLKPPAERQSLFVRKVHAYACRTFGTTLGPNANAAHRNHFHFDMKYRRGGFCQ